ncbi:MAG: AIPR family protein [Verrucomicrobia bacterium]|nr:AIPR family protein [Verrucomicrobiota bacterium]
MKIQEFLNYRKELLDSSKDEEGFVQQTQLLSQILPLMVDAKLLDSEDWNDSYYLNPAENYKVNGYTVNESSERLQLFIVDETSIDLTASEKDLQISTKSYYDNQFKRVTRFLNKAIKGYLNDEVQDADPIRPLLSQLSSATGAEQFDVIEIFLVSASATTETRGTLPQPKRIEFEDENISVSFTRNRERVKKDLLIIKKLVDLNFLFDVLISQGNREALTIDFENLFNYKIEVIKAAEEENFESYLCVLPAHILSDLYKRYSSRLLEKNVRSFLQFKGANKGIRETIRISPEKFIAFNNGITITSTSKDLETKNGKLFIKSLTDFQIVNGGQTTASIYFTQKDGFPIDKVKVMAKINVALDVNEEGLDSLISDISKFSNSQTKVSNVDLSSRSPQLNKLKALSDSIVTPSGRKWFFEKSRGEFNTKLRIAGSNRARIEKEYPKNYRFTKEQLGKYFTSWGEQPYVVKKGGEKVFRYFLEEIAGELRGKKTINVNRDFYEELISKIILFTQLEKIYGQGKHSMGQIRSAVVPYAISVIYIYTDGAKTGKQFDLSKIWKKEKLEDDLVTFFTELMELMNGLIKKYSESDDYGEYAKNRKLWEDISASKEIEKFMTSKIAQQILSKYSIPVREKKNGGTTEVDFERIQMNIEVLSKGVEFYNQLRKKYDGLSKHQGNKIDTIISSIIKLEDLSVDHLRFESNLINEVRKNSPEIFDQINTPYNYQIESTLKLIILKYNQAIENGFGLNDFFKSIEQKTSVVNNKYSSVFNKIAVELEKGVAPSVKDIQLASNYFNKETTPAKETPSGAAPKINLIVLRQMVEWDSRMKILSNGERQYMADLAYELKPLNQFHKTNAEKHLKTLLNAGFKLKGL